jgi:hypothetical protein
MQKTIALALVVASLAAFPAATPTFAGDSSITALCGPDAPESYKRPGGYCDQVRSNDSLLPKGDGAECFYYPTAMQLTAVTKPQLVAAYCEQYVSRFAPAAV